ncbi:MAG: addiction module protein [Nannocystaceae bacterium]
MGPDAERILEAARALPAEDRAALATVLLDSLEHEPPAAVQSAWDDELRRRLQAYRAGQTLTRPIEDVEREAEAMLAAASNGGWMETCIEG